MLRNLTLLLAAGAAFAPAAAHAESISYLKDGDVWLAAVDGSNAARLTTGGGHISPSQSDDGTIAVGKGDKILLLDRAGAVLGTLDPPGLPDKRGVTRRRRIGTRTGTSTPATARASPTARSAARATRSRSCAAARPAATSTSSG